jgi:diaminohydroxyphosphoribosylaminopyrimidine deaminase/5-amino-6-(5-phosphoribosylamino)uracil reductase
MKLTPEQAMRLAIDEAKKGSGFVSPNPLVGCVILNKNAELIGSGYHARVGDVHAEISALRNVKDSSQLEGAHLFVTLEPCAHHGRTPPCAEALAKLPLASVTYGLLDPNPKVSGKGLEVIKAAGIEVKPMPDMQEELENVAEHFLMNMRHRRPFVSLKVATSLDGQMALASGESQWITGEEARAHVQYLRGLHDAVMIGLGTFMADDPKLNSRDERFKDKSQKAILLDPEGRTVSRLAKSAALSVRKKEDFFLVTHPQVVLPPELAGIQHLKIEMTRENWNWNSIFSQLFEHGVYSVLVEGGSYVFSELIRERHAHRLYMYMSPKILGARQGLSWTKDLSIEKLSQGWALSRMNFQNFGPDVLITGRLTSSLENEIV